MVLVRVNGIEVKRDAFGLGGSEREFVCAACDSASSRDSSFREQ